MQVLRVNATTQLPTPSLQLEQRSNGRQTAQLNWYRDIPLKPISPSGRNITISDLYTVEFADHGHPRCTERVGFTDLQEAKRYYGAHTMDWQLVSPKYETNW